MFNYRIVVANKDLFNSIFKSVGKDYNNYKEIVNKYNSVFKPLAAWMLARDSGLSFALAINASNSAIKVAGTGLKLPLWADNLDPMANKRIVQRVLSIIMSYQITHQDAFPL
jgi:hypothetical protein